MNLIRGLLPLETPVLKTPVLKTYSIKNEVGPSECTSYFDNYGCYAIEWNNGENSSFQLSYFDSSPRASTLQAYETDTTYYSSNPRGDWFESSYFGSGPDTELNQFAVGAAKEINDWGTPVFFNAGVGTFDEKAVLESITFNIYFGNDLSDVCGTDFDNKDANPESVASSCAFFYGDDNTFGFEVDSAKIAYWSPSTNRRDQTISRSTLRSYLDDSFSDVYVYDPPSAEVATVEAASVPEPTFSFTALSFLGLFGFGSLLKRTRK